MIDWERNKQLLLVGAKLAFQKFFAAHKGCVPSAVGFVFELRNVSIQFDPCAEIKRSREKMISYNERDRWNSGDYSQPAGLLNYEELGEDWIKESARLHELARKKEWTQSVYDGLIRISCEVLAELAASGLFGNWRHVDFNVSEVNDSEAIVCQRDAIIRSQIAVIQ